MRKSNAHAVCVGLLALSGLLLTGCFGVKPTGTQKRSSLYETFFVGEEGMQYFIKPLEFVSEEKNDEKMRMDFTFRHAGEASADGRVTVNLSLYSLQRISGGQDFSLQSGEKSVGLQDCRMLFQEKKKNYFHVRYTATIGMEEFIALFQKNDWRASCREEGKEKHFIASGKTQKQIKRIDGLAILPQ